MCQPGLFQHRPNHSNGGYEYAVLPSILQNQEVSIPVGPKWHWIDPAEPCLLSSVYPWDGLSWVGRTQHSSSPSIQITAWHDGLARSHCWSFLAHPTSKTQYTVYLVGYPRGLTPPLGTICQQSETGILSLVTNFHLFLYGRTWGWTSCLKCLIFVWPWQ